MMMIAIIIIMQPPFIISSLCGRHFVYIISFNFLNRHYKSGNRGLATLNNLTNVTQLLSDSHGIRTESGESHALTIALLLMISTFGEVGFYLEYPTPCLLTDQETEAGELQ